MATGTGLLKATIGVERVTAHLIIVIFEVRPRIPQPIPDDVTVRLAPAGSDPLSDESKVYQLNDTWVTVYIENKSSRRLKWNVLDPEYAYHLQLFKDDVQIPYTKEITDITRLKEENLQQVYIESDRFIEEKTISGLQNINLSNWYGPLAPGMYRLIIRRRLEFDGPWTRDSLPMLFEVPPKRR